jgi:hypothetical protein
MPKKIYQELAMLLNAQENCLKSGNSGWFELHGDAIADIMRNAPSGAGIDAGTAIDLKASRNGEKLVFTFSYHFMNEVGYYDGWGEYRLTVRPSLMSGIDLTITGSNRNEIKDYLYDVYDMWLNQECIP